MLVVSLCKCTFNKSTKTGCGNDQILLLTPVCPIGSLIVQNLQEIHMLTARNDQGGDAVDWWFLHKLLRLSFPPSLAPKLAGFFNDEYPPSKSLNEFERIFPKITLKADSHLFN
jgi:hypothetical protein